MRASKCFILTANVKVSRPDARSAYGSAALTSWAELVAYRSLLVRRFNRDGNAHKQFFYAPPMRPLFKRAGLADDKEQCHQHEHHGKQGQQQLDYGHG